MPFITNDFDHLLVDDEEYVKEKYKNYVILRKLYVWLNDPFPDSDVSLSSSVDNKCGCT